MNFKFLGMTLGFMGFRRLTEAMFADFEAT